LGQPFSLAARCLLQETLPELLKNKGTVINVSSTLGQLANPSGVAYGAVKAAQNMVSTDSSVCTTPALPAGTLYLLSLTARS
jgi:NAD(P)-dependent dehydrogenase (short-subunit alcohol dehydrogenase family)